jgi:hypothetical protein
MLITCSLRVTLVLSVIPFIKGGNNQDAKYRIKDRAQTIADADFILHWEKLKTVYQINQ